MTFRLSDGADHDVHLIDDGTMDTVIMVDGRQHSFSSESVAALRDRRGSLSEDGMVELAEMTIENEPWDMSDGDVTCC